MGDSKNVSAEQHNAVRREVKAKQYANSRANAVHKDSEEHEEFECDFIGRFDQKTEEALAEIQRESGFVTAGLVYSLVQEDSGKVVISLSDPEPALVALNAVGHKIVVRPFAFRSHEVVGKKNAAGEWEEVVQDTRTPFRCRSILVPVAPGFAIRFKYNPVRQCVVVC